MSFDAKDYPINDIISKSVFSIPRNQRRYVWKQDNWCELFEDVIIATRDETRPHFLGSIVLKDDGKKDGLAHYTIIDGQQRLTTITVFIVALLIMFKQHDMEDDFLGTLSYVMPTNNKNQEKILINSDYHISLSNIIKGIKEYSKETSVLAYIKANIVSKSKDKLIGDALRYFYDEIGSYLKDKEDVPNCLLDIRNAIIDMIVVRIVSTSEEDSYTIFEILNARGQDLQDHELLKNYIMRHVHPEEKRDEAKQIWENIENTLGTSIKKFIKHYTTHKFGNPQGKESSYRVIQKATKGTDIYSLLKDISLKAMYYEKFINSCSTGEHQNCSQLEEEIFTFFKKKKSEQFRPILLSLIHQYELENISLIDYENMIKYIYNFFVCYNVIGAEKSNKMEDVVYKYAKILEDDYSKDNLKLLAKSMKNKIPSYEWFVNAFKTVGWSKKDNIYSGEKNKMRVQTVLEIIEKFLSQRAVVEEFTIEHINLDADSIENAQVGNLIPLEYSLNQRCANKSVSEKSSIYLESNFKTARNLADRIKNGNFDASQRTEFLAKLIYNNILELDQLEFE